MYGNNDIMANLQKSNLHIGVISNIIFEPHFIPFMKSYFDENTKIFPITYGEHNDDEYRKKLEKSNVIVVWLNFELIYPNIYNSIYSKTITEQQVIEKTINLCNSLYSELITYSNADILWFLFEDCFFDLNIVLGNYYYSLIDKINLELCDNITGGITFLNLKRLITEIGATNAYDPKGKYRWNAPYSKTLIEAAVKEINKQYLIKNGITKKCIVLDCDNVLWGGIISEDCIEKIKLGGNGLGRSYQDFQRFVLSLYYHGVILTVCSKNDLSDIMIMFNEHSEMLLKEKHIAYFQVNWENKPDNIKRIAEILNIGLDSIVFIDDSLIEIEAVKSMLPEVTTILYERDSVYKQLSCFNLKNSSNIMEIEKRNETYKTNQSRETLKFQYVNYNDYIDALEIKIDIHEALPIEFNRISELTQRTNKCTNGKRYTVAEIKERTRDNNIKLYSLSASDRFSDLGLVGAMEIEGISLTLFNLSCRALGREFEKKMLTFIKDNHDIKKIEFYNTDRNANLTVILAKEIPNATIAIQKIE